MESLKCSICGKPAIVHIERSIDGAEQSINLCETCARNYGVLPNNVVPFSVAKNICAALFGDLNPSVASHGRCGHCGCTLEQFKKTGNLGCPQCYEDLKEKLSPLIENMQKSTKHIGKQPKSFVVQEKGTSRKEALEKKLQQAIRDEHFEEAAKIRDQLRLLS